MRPTIVLHSADPTASFHALVERCYTQTVRDIDVLIATTFPVPDLADIQAYFPVSTLELPPGTSTGAMLNAAFDRAAGEVVVIVDAGWMPRDEHWLMRLLRHFSDVGVVAVSGCDFDRERVSITKPWYRQDLLDVLTGPEFGLGFSNAAILRDAWRRQPFDSSNPACADKQWAYMLLREGAQIRIDYEARCHEGEPLDAEALFRRYWAMNLAFGQFVRMEEDLKLELRRALAEGWQKKSLRPLRRIFQRWTNVRQQRFWRQDDVQVVLARQHFQRAGGKWAV